MLEFLTANKQSLSEDKQRKLDEAINNKNFSLKDVELLIDDLFNQARQNFDDGLKAGFEYGKKTGIWRHFLVFIKHT